MVRCYLFIGYLWIIISLNLNNLHSSDAITGTANSKLSVLMNNIRQTLYDPTHDVIPSVDISVVINPFKTKHAFTDTGDIMQNGRQKSIHKRGLVFEARYVPIVRHYGYNYTGIFEKGCNGIGRFSFAVNPTIDIHGVMSVLYGFAMKCLLDNENSVNFFAMHSLNPQNTYNLFKYNYSNLIPEPASIATKIGAQSFRMAKYLARGCCIGCCTSKDTDPNYLSLDPMAQALNGDNEYKAPHAIVCVPSDDIKNVYNSDEQNIDTTDFRNILNGKGKSVKVFDIYAEIAQPNSRIGEIYAMSDFVASTFGDQQLFFQHPL